MAFADPQSVTLGSAISMPRITLDNLSGTFAPADSTSELAIRHYLPGNRKRSVVKISRKKISTSPLTDLKSEESASITITIDRPKSNAFTEAELIELATGFNTWFSAGTNANLKKLLGLES